MGDPRSEARGGGRNGVRTDVCSPLDRSGNVDPWGHTIETQPDTWTQHRDFNGVETSARSNGVCLLFEGPEETDTA